MIRILRRVAGVVPVETGAANLLFVVAPLAIIAGVRWYLRNT